MSFVEKIKEIASEVCIKEGCRLYDLEFQTGSRGQGRRLLIYVDKAGNGATLEDCEKVSKGVSSVLDVEDIIPGEDYVLEVSTPGIEKPLKEKWHFEGAIGSKVFVHSNESILSEAHLENDDKNGIKRFKVTGKLAALDGDSIIIEAEGQSFRIPIAQVKKSHVIFDFEATKQQKKKN